MNLLVVDDDSVIRNVLRTLLKGEGHSVTTAADATDALRKLSEVSYDLVITDIHMPGIDGVRFRDMIRERGNRTTPILFISGYDEAERMARIMDESREAFFRKGRPLTELLAWINYFGMPERRRKGRRPGQTKKRLPHNETPTSV